MKLSDCGLTNTVRNAYTRLLLKLYTVIILQIIDYPMTLKLDK